MLTAPVRGGAGVRVGIGDDAAVVVPRPGRDLLLTCDMVAEGIHFRRAWYEHQPERLGRKALAVNISDVAGMGGEPRFAVITLAAAPQVPVEFLRRAYCGLADLAHEWGVSIVGGDTVRLESGLLLDVFLVGDVACGGALLRSGARPDDLIVVTGEFGLSRAGLDLLDLKEQAGPPAAVTAEDRAAAVSRQLEPPVRLREAAALAGTSCLHALSDTSDGLANQVHLICEASGVGAVVREDQIPVSPVAGRVALARGADALSWALFGGEDYELIAAVAPADWDRVQAAMTAAVAGSRLTVVGRFTPERDVVLERATGAREQLAFAGWDHFRVSGTDGGPRAEAARDGEYGGS